MPTETRTETLEEIIDRECGRRAFLKLTGLGIFTVAAASFPATLEAATPKVKTKRRDPFGEDPGSGHKARQEGGVLISLPEARQAYYSGNGDHEERWIKQPGTRDKAHYPSHVKHAFFLQSGSGNARVTGAEGDFIIYPWDHDFGDNGRDRTKMMARIDENFLDRPV